MATQLSKSQVIEKIATTTELSKRDVKNVMDTLVDVGHKELKKNGVFLVPGFALLLGLAVVACDQRPKTAANTIPPQTQLDTSHHGGGVTTQLPARTGSEESGVEGSSTVIGAPPKGQNPAANAHGSS